MGRHKAEDRRQVFDVSKPGRSAPSPTSRPVIVNHGSSAEDPMVTSHDNPGLMNHNAKPVVPIQVNSHESTGQTEQPADAAGVPGINDFGSYPTSSPGGHSEQAQETSHQTETSQAVPVEPSSKAQEDSAADQELPAPAEGQTEQSQAGDVPLPEELVRPEADDPVGLSSFALPTSAEQAPGPESLSENAGLTNRVTEEHREYSSETAGQQAETKTEDQLPIVPDNIGEIERLPDVEDNSYVSYAEEGRRRLWLIPVLAMLLAVFFVLDAGIVGTGNLPFEVLKEPEEAPKTQVPAATTSKASTAAATPAEPKTPLGFSQYNVPATPLSFSYPTTWGNPITSTDEGFSKRGGNNKSDGVYSHLITFENNKDVQLALTSSKYLPPKREALYYDYLQWCSGTHDGKIYRQKLLFSTAGNVDTPTTISCSDGPVADATKIDETTIVQLNTKDLGNKPIGDVYTKNLLSSDEYVVLRAKDASMSHGDSIKQLLSNAKLANTN